MKIYQLIFATFIVPCSTGTTDQVVQSADFRQIATRTDSSFTKFKVDNITACYTTLTDLRRHNLDLKKINHNELDSFFVYYSHHSDNYFIDSDKGLLIGTYERTELV